jgi:heat shock protein 1/8
MLVGHAAKAQAEANHTNTVFNFCRFFGRKFSDGVVQSELRHLPFRVVEGAGDSPLIEVTHLDAMERYHPLEMYVILLGKLKEDVETFVRRPVGKAVLTVPAYFSDGLRTTVKDAGTMAGLEVLRVLNAPTAVRVHGSLGCSHQCWQQA